MRNHETLRGRTRQEMVGNDGEGQAGRSNEDAGSFRRGDNNYDVASQDERRDMAKKSGGLRFRTVDGRTEERRPARVDLLRALQQAKEAAGAASNGSLDRRL